MHELEWPQPPVRFDDLAKVLELLGDDAERVLRGWVLVQAPLDSPTGPFRNPQSQAHTLIIRGAE